MKRQEFKEDEIPYSLLEPFGLSQDMIEDLPAGMLNIILARRAHSYDEWFGRKMYE